VDSRRRICYRPARAAGRKTRPRQGFVGLAPKAPATGRAGAAGRDGLTVHCEGGLALVQIVVRDNNVEQALRALKKKMQREGTFREMKRRKFYEKPSEKRARQKAEAIRRARKLIRKRLQREGAL
jgi:small subunit ribosomal protein S21